jgi:hypothetical protein
MVGCCSVPFVHFVTEQAALAGEAMLKNVSTATPVAAESTAVFRAVPFIIISLLVLPIAGLRCPHLANTWLAALFRPDAITDP